MRSRICAVIAALGLLGSACGPASGLSSEPTEAGARSGRVLVILQRLEPPFLTSRVTAGGETGLIRALFNAGLTYVDEREVPRPYLAEDVPRLDTDSWRVFPDGRMETTYRLKPGLVWHDGTPLTAGDFVFARRAASDPASQLFSISEEDKKIEEVVAVDSRTVLFRWKGVLREAGELWYEPMPRHILESAFERDDPASFANHPYWTTEYINVGPYRVERWDRGALIETAAFPQFALGSPRIQRIIVRWAPDANVALANLLAGEVHMLAGNALPFASATVLRRAWEDSQAGTVLLNPSQVKYLQVQHRPEYAKPAAILDLSVRRALVHALDRQALADVILEGNGVPADTFIATNAVAYPAVERAITRYVYDPRRAEQLLQGAGFRRGADGLFADAGGARLDPELRGRAGQEDQEAAISVDSWRRAGVDAGLEIISAAQSANSEFRSTFPGFAVSFTGITNGGLDKMITSMIPTPGNRWVGNNRGAWSNAAIDRLYEQFNAALDRDKLPGILAEAMKAVSEEIGVIPLYYSYVASAHGVGLSGPRAQGGLINIYQWEWK